MPRPQKIRQVAFLPQVTFFKPAGVPMRALEQVALTVEEVEALRLKEIEGLEQEQGAEKMNISRPTFQRVLASARRKIADALLNGKAIRIEGGNYAVAPVRYRCANSHEWQMPFEQAVRQAPDACPVCNTADLAPLQPITWGGMGKGRRFHRGNF